MEMDIKIESAVEMALTLPIANAHRLSIIQLRVHPDCKQVQRP